MGCSADDDDTDDGDDTDDADGGGNGDDDEAINDCARSHRSISGTVARATAGVRMACSAGDGSKAAIERCQSDEDTGL